MHLDSHVAIVTGAADGNGKAIAERLASEGIHVVCGDVDTETLDTTVQAIRKGGGMAEAVACDVRSDEQVEGLFRTADELGGARIVVAQAGGRFSRAIEHTSTDEWDRMMDVDVKGAFLCVRAAIPRLRAIGGGSIVLMSGTYAYSAEPGISASAAAKGAILAFTRAVAVEVGDLGIRCNCVVPGYVETGMVKRYVATIDNAEAAYSEVTRRHALGRFATPEEVAAMVVFLCSDQASFSTGQAYFVDGGLSAGVTSYNWPIIREAARGPEGVGSAGVG